MVPRVFISYRRTSSQLARLPSVVEALKNIGVECFYDVEDIDALADFPTRIRQGIAESHAFLAWWSNEYGESEHCLAEFKLGWQHARRHSSDVGRRVWVLNPEPGADHIFAGELNAKNFLQPPSPGAEATWAQTLLARLQSLLLEGPLADERQLAPVPRLINVPVPSTEFTGRNVELLRIHSKLHPPRIGSAGLAVAVQIHGLAGVGKTELAAKYAHDFAHAYPGGIVWLHLGSYAPEPSRAKIEEAETAWYKAIEVTFRGEADLLYDTQGKARPAQQVRRMLEEQYSTTQPYLWVLDDVPVLLPESEREKVLAFWRAPNVHGRTMITTRDSRPAGGFAEERLDVLAEKDACRVLARYRRQLRDEESIARELAREVGGHPLALILLGEHLRHAPGGYARARERLGETGMLARIETIADNLRTELGEKARGILASFALSFEILDEDALTVLALAAVCAPNERIPAGLLADTFAAVTRESAFRAALRRWLSLLPFFRSAERGGIRSRTSSVLRASLLARRHVEPADNDCVEIHPLVAEAVLSLLEVDRANMAECVANALLQRIQVVAGDIRCHAEIGADVRQARHVSSTLESESAVWLAIWVWPVEHARGALLLARAAEERALDVGRHVLGEEHPATVFALNNLAGTLQAQGDLAAARALQENALAVIRKYLNEEDEITISFISNLGTMLQGQGKLTEARTVHERTLELRRRVLGEEHPDTLLSMSNLAGALLDLGDLTGARVLQAQALAIYRRVLGEEHPDTLRSTINLAQVYYTEGDLAGARALQERVLEAQRRVMGEANPATLTSMNNLVLTLQSQGDLVGARALNDQTLELNRQTLGDEHPDTLRSMNNLGAFLYAGGDLAGARVLQERVLAAQRRIMGETHPAALLSMNNLALTLQAQGDLGRSTSA